MCQDAVGHDNDIFADAVGGLMANSEMLDENGDSVSPGWEGGAHLGSDAQARAVRSTAEVELNGATLTSIVEKGQNGTVKMTIM